MYRSDMIAVLHGTLECLLCDDSGRADPLVSRSESLLRVDRDVMREYVSYPVDVGRAVGMQLYIYHRLFCVVDMKGKQSRLVGDR
jgi:hypothetical protein